MNYETFEKITKDWPEYHKVKFLIDGPNWAILFEKMVRDNWDKIDDYITVGEIAEFANHHGLIENTNLEVIE